MIELALLCALTAGDPSLVLKERVTVHGRHLRLADLVDAPEEARPALATIYLGRAADEGRTRVVEAEEVRRALHGRGLTWTVAGEKVVVRSAEAAIPDGVRRRAVQAVKRRVLEARPELRPGDLDVQLSFPPGLGCGESARVTGASARQEIGFGSQELMVTLMTAGGRSEIPVRARIGRARGAQGEPDNAAAVRKGDIVRALSAHFEVDARALADGGVGEEIALEVVSNRNRVRGRVLEAGRVELEEGR